MTRNFMFLLYGISYMLKINFVFEIILADGDRSAVLAIRFLSPSVSGLHKTPADFLDEVEDVRRALLERMFAFP